MRQDAELIQYDATMRRMLSSFAKCRADRKARGEDLEPTGRTQAEIDAEANYLMDRAESEAINLERVT